jgi:DNA-binding transcriptional LysR family regulator
LPVVIVELLAKVIGRLGREYPNMVVKIRPEASSRLFVALAEGELDCVIARLPQAGAHGESYEAIRKVLSGLHVEVLYEEPQCLIVGKAHPLARKKRVSWKEMAKERWLRPVSEGGVHRVIADGFASAGHSVPPASVECEHFMYAIRIVAESDLLAVVPRHEALRFADMVTPLPLPERITAAPIVFATRKADADDAIIAAFRRVVGSVAATFKRDSARR